MQLSHPLLLASGSPRRKEILTNAGFEFAVHTKEVEEIYPSEILPQNVPEYLAHLKASAFVHESDNNIIIAADTIVVLNGEILGKPKNEKHALAMLQAMSGHVHDVISGVCIYHQGNAITFSDKTRVVFKNLAVNEIEHYIATFKPFDKAGAYGIQEWIGMIGIESIFGSYYNVMGLPIHLVYKELMRYQISKT